MAIPIDIYPSITSLEGFINYCKVMLGSGTSEDQAVLVVEVSDEQFVQIATDTIQEFGRYSYGEANWFEPVVFNVSAGQMYYAMAGQNIAGAFDMTLSLSIDGINTLFSPTHELLYSDFVGKGTPFTTGGGFDTSPGLIMTSFDIAMQYLEEIKTKFGKYYTVKWLPQSEKLQVLPTPSENGTGIVYLYKREATAKLYNHPNVKKLALAKAKQVWGRNLSGKYAGGVPLPDGLVVDGSALLAEGKADEAEILALIKAESEPIEFFVA